MEEEDLFGSSPPDTAAWQDDSPQPELKPLPAVLHLDDQSAEPRQDAPLAVVHEKLNTPTKVLEANESRRKSDPKFVCPVESCETTFTRSVSPSLWLPSSLRLEQQLTLSLLRDSGRTTWRVTCARTTVRLTPRARSCRGLCH